jgi:hypothetical protein
MRKTLMVLGVASCATLLVNSALACDGEKARQASNEGASCAKSAAVQANYDGASCAKSAAKAAYDKSFEETGCEKSAQTEYRNTLAENAYTKSYAETSCGKTALKAAYETVYAETGCEKSSRAAATHAVAKASYDATYAKTGCAKTAQAAYDGVTKTGGSSCAVAAAETGCDKDSDQEKIEKAAEADVKVASKNPNSSR